MTRIVRIVMAATVLFAGVPPAVWAESAVPDPGSFFSQTPGLFDPNASGTKLSGTMTIAYEFGPAGAGCSSVTIENMFVVLTLAQGNDLKPFNLDFTKTAPATAPFCFDNQTQQVNFVVGLVTSEVIPYFFGCDPTVVGACPGFEVKSVTDFLSTGTGAVSAGITLAVH